MVDNDCLVICWNFGIEHIQKNDKMRTQNESSGGEDFARTTQYLFQGIKLYFRYLKRWHF